MASNDDEDDYMSDAFLQKCADVRPGLKSGKVVDRHKKEAKTKKLNIENRQKPKKVLEKEKREEGLEKALDEKNKGFALLQKMGFKTGMSLGKRGGGRKEPVPLQIKAGRSGLGHDSELKRKQSEVAEMRMQMARKRMKKNQEYQANYREHKSKIQAERDLERDLYKSQRACQQLDMEKGIAEAPETFFWPEGTTDLTSRLVEDEEGYSREVQEVSEEEESEEEEEETPPVEFSTREKLEILTRYLRKYYNYCIWCGTKYEDDPDLRDHCPGPTSAHHEDM